MRYDPPNIASRVKPPEGASCAGCGRPFSRMQDAVTRDGKTFYHVASDGGCESRTAKSKGAKL